ncbi:MAG TPA: protein kinase [Chloroflexaceae bacterium]|nr:protein kinase [Chloroflexaceae bacterium]
MSTSRAPARVEKRAAEGATELRNYKLHERLSQEELATVYSATHLTLDRPVEVHLLRRQGWISVSRFQLAARLAARLSHPNLVAVIDAGHDEKYGDYLVTPQLDARPLSAILADGPLTPLQAVRVASQVASALDYLHGQQVFHRDVQPANILVGVEGLAYLANLSLAASPDTPDLSSIEEADYLTPYSAPEQRLTKGEAGAALDVYSLGAVVYHMLSGEVPPAPGAELPSLAARDPNLVAADRVVRRMVAPQPGARFATPGAAVAALRQALRGQIDQATADMEESRWEASAEWLENPVETAIGPTLDEGFRDYLARTRKRADELHRRDVIRRILNRWSRDGFFRRRGLGQLIAPEQIVSYNVYFYELRTLYESRAPAEPRTRPHKPEDRSASQLPPELWAAPVPEVGPFDAVAPQEIALPHSTRILSCPECAGATVVHCKECKGSGIVEKVRKVSTPDNKHVDETLTSPCPACQGYGRQQCPRCEGTGNLVEEQFFTWSRRARLFENTDDIEDLPQLAIKRRLEPVFAGPIDPFEGRWHSVAPLAELLRAAIEEAGADTRLSAAELKIHGATITEMDFLLDEKPQRLYLVGFDNELIGDWTLLNPERLLVAALVALLALLALVAVALVLLQ